MKIKTSDLIGPALDWAVAKCEKFFYFPKPEGPTYVQEGTDVWYHSGQHSPSTNRNQGGSIIEREGIGIFANLTEIEAQRFKDAHADWRACPHRKLHKHWFGQTPLIAAMRCYVAQKLGDEVEIPQELT